MKITRASVEKSILHGGWSVPGLELHIGILPGRKSPALYEVKGGALTVFAYFRNIYCAVEAIGAINELIFNAGSPFMGIELPPEMDAKEEDS